MIRAVIICVLGAFMALVVYAGQVGYGRDVPEKRIETPKAIHESQVKGYEFSYQLVNTEGPFSFYRNIPYQLAGQSSQDTFEGAPKPQLILFITDSLGNEIVDAKVKYKIVGPQKDILEAGGFPVKGGYAAGIYCTDPGTYKIEAEIELSDYKKTLVDRFAFYNRP
jgi:hypothetical protein